MLKWIPMMGVLNPVKHFDMSIHKIISDLLREPFTRSQTRRLMAEYSDRHNVPISNCNLQDVADWARSGLSKTRVGCTGKNRYTSRKEAKQKLKSFRGRQDGDGVYECAHCQGWHVTSKLRDDSTGIFAYYLYGKLLK